MIQPDQFHNQLHIPAPNNHSYNFSDQPSINSQPRISQPAIYSASISQPVIHGAKKFTSFLKIFIPFILVAPLISYHMAVKKGE